VNQGLQDMDKLRELVRLHREKFDKRDVARLVGISPVTEQKYRKKLEAAGLLWGDPQDLPELDVLAEACASTKPKPPQERSSVEPWRARIAALVADGVRPTAIHQVLREEDRAFKASLSAVKRLVLQLARERGAHPDDVAIPVETPAGEVAQVDFGYAGYVLDPAVGRARKAWLFVMVLGCSRHMFCKVVFDQATDTWLRLHVEAFAFFGGVPRVVVPDNLKAAVIRAAFGADEIVAENRAYRELARHHGFVIDPTPPRSPEKKGKVERSVQYVKNAFLDPREFVDVDDLNRRLTTWVVDVAGARRHGTTGKKPLEHFERIEKAALLPLPAKRFEPVTWRKATVQRDCCVRFDEERWSVPFRHVGREALLRATAHSLEVYVDDRRVATHDRTAPGPHIDDAHLPEGRRDERHRDRGHWEARADAIDPEVVGVFVRAVMDRDEVQRPLRRVASILRLLEAVPRERAVATCTRAAYFGAYDADTVRKILVSGMDAQPLPSTTPMAPSFTPRFAREAASFLASAEVAYGTC
jgi:transposase